MKKIAGGSARNFGERIGVSFGDLAPLIGRLEIEAVAVGEPEEGRSAPVGVAGATLSGDLDEAERDQLADGGCDRVAVYAVLNELGGGDRQSAVVLAAVVAVLDLDTGENLMGGAA